MDSVMVSFCRVNDDDRDDLLPMMLKYVLLSNIISYVSLPQMKEKIESYFKKLLEFEIKVSRKISFIMSFIRLMCLPAFY